MLSDFRPVSQSLCFIQVLSHQIKAAVFISKQDNRLLHFTMCSVVISLSLKETTAGFIVGGANIVKHFYTFKSGNAMCLN